MSEYVRYAVGWKDENGKEVTCDQCGQERAIHRWVALDEEWYRCESCYPLSRFKIQHKYQ